ncbi:MAG: serine hydrolase [bacterium]|nr:serine hydrolase [bacterium]
MKRTLLLLLFILSLSALGLNAGVDVPKTTAEKEKPVSELEKALPRLMEEALVPGLAAAVIRDGKIQWIKGFGVKSVDTKEAVTPDTLFQACSLGKQVFTYAVMKLVERGKLDLDKPLTEYVTEPYIEKAFLNGKIKDPRFRKITARMVLSHTSGFPNWRRGKEIPIRFEPGSKFGYSGEGVVYLQKVVEKITGAGFNEFMNREVFKPLGMEQSSFLWEKAYDTNPTRGHSALGKVEELWKPKEENAAYSLFCSTREYTRFLCALLNGEGISEKNLQTMLGPRIEVLPGVSWGVGVGLQHADGAEGFWQWGDNDNFKCFFLAFKKEKTAVVFFTNATNGLTLTRDILHHTVGGRHPVFKMGMFKPYDSPRNQVLFTIAKKGADAAVERCRQLRKNEAHKKLLGERFLITMGYFLLRKNKPGDALKFFQYNAETFPESFNAFDSLAEAHMKNGDKEQAIKFYKKSLQLNPENKNAREMLKKLEKH